MCPGSTTETRQWMSWLLEHASCSNNQSSFISEALLAAATCRAIRPISRGRFGHAGPSWHR